MVRKHTRARSRFRRIAGRPRFKRHPKLITRAINALGAAIAFSPEIESGLNDWQNGNWMRVPQQSLGHLAAATTGYDPGNGTFDPNKLTGSISAKVGGIVFVKVAKYFLKRFRF